MAFQVGAFQTNYQQIVTAVTVTPLTDGGGGHHKERRRQHERLPFSPQEYLDSLFENKPEEAKSTESQVADSAQPLSPVDLEIQKYMHEMFGATDDFIARQEAITKQSEQMRLKRNNMLAAVLLLLD